jgi:predicted DCC family thiol-disulfide oxidoreductase YuxK
MESKMMNFVLYDGDCGFCSRSVAFILKHEKSDLIHFAPLQSEFTKNLFKKNDWAEPNLSTFYFIQNGIKHERSAAAFEVVKYLKFPYSWLRVFRFIPRRITDWFYNQVAKRRQRISKGFCVLPTPEQRARFQLN